jgi:NAD(P)-dependent dehydrogenase (short-subunit alcohol dehydrogenase family)
MKSVIITGANSGLGFACAKEIARTDEGWHIIMACRNLQKGNEAMKELRALYPAVTVSVMQLDLASLESVRSFVAAFAAAGLPALQGLINNAGLQVMSGLEYTQDGFELTFGTNHLGHFLLTC